MTGASANGENERMNENPRNDRSRGERRRLPYHAAEIEQHTERYRSPSSSSANEEGVTVNGKNQFPRKSGASNTTGNSTKWASRSNHGRRGPSEDPNGRARSNHSQVVGDQYNRQKGGRRTGNKRVREETPRGGRNRRFSPDSWDRHRAHKLPNNRRESESGSVEEWKRRRPTHGSLSDGSSGENSRTSSASVDDPRARRRKMLERLRESGEEELTVPETASTPTELYSTLLARSANLVAIERASKSRAADLEDDAERMSISSGGSGGELDAEEQALEDALASERLVMQQVMGFSQFGSSKGGDHRESDLSGIKRKTKRKYRQYMNRKGGFNRPLSPVF